MGKTFFLPGDIVTIKQSLEIKPVMWVVKKETALIKDNENGKEFFKGIRCR